MKRKRSLDEKDSCVKIILQWLKKYFWEKWLWGISALSGALGMPAFFNKTLQESISISYAALIFLLVIIIGLCYGIFVEIIKQRVKEKEHPVYFEYNNDIFDGCKYEWVWDYVDTKDGWCLGRIVQKCLNCDFEIVNGLCQECDTGSIVSKSREEIKAYISREIDTKYDDVRGIEVT